MQRTNAKTNYSLPNTQMELPIMITLVFIAVIIVIGALYFSPSDWGGKH